MLLDQKNGEEISCFSEFRVFLDLFTPIVDDLSAEVTKSPCIASLISFKRCNMVSCEEWEQDNVRGAYSVYQIRKGDAKTVGDRLFSLNPVLPEVNRRFSTIDSECTDKKDTSGHETNFIHDVNFSARACR